MYIFNALLMYIYIHTKYLYMELIIEIIHTRNFLLCEDRFVLHMATAPLQRT